MSHLPSYHKLIGSLLLGIAVVVLSACGGSGSRAITALRHTGLDYGSGKLMFSVQHTVLPVIPETSGEPIINYSIAPALPDGLSFNTSSGVISGTPTVISPTTLYTIIGTTAAGMEIPTGLTLTVQATETPPILLHYGCSDCDLVAGQRIHIMLPITEGEQIEHFSTLTPLPTGLSIDSRTGAISGTPSAIGTKTVTVVGSDAAGQVSFDMTFHVTASSTPPTNLTYGEDLIVLSLSDDLPMDTLTPVHGGGQCASYTFSVALEDGTELDVVPVGLNLNAENGDIGGKRPPYSITITSTCHPTNSLGFTVASAFNLLIPEAMAAELPASTTISIKMADLKKGFFGIKDSKVIYDTANDFYYDGAFVWSKISDVKMNKSKAKEFCESKAPILAGKRWDLPGTNAILRINASTIATDNKSGDQGWQWGQPGVWVEPGGWLSRGNYSYIMGAPFSNEPPPEGDAALLYVTCFLE